MAPARFIYSLNQWLFSPDSVPGTAAPVGLSTSGEPNNNQKPNEDKIYALPQCFVSSHCTDPSGHLRGAHGDTEIELKLTNGTKREGPVPCELAQSRLAGAGGGGT